MKDPYREIGPAWRSESTLSEEDSHELASHVKNRYSLVIDFFSFKLINRILRTSSGFNFPMINSLLHSSVQYSNNQFNDPGQETLVGILSI